MKQHASKLDTPIFALQDAAIRVGESLVFKGLCWVWRRGEQWAVLGPNGSGKSLLADALAGRAPVVRGSLQWFGIEDSLASPTVAIVSPQTQRALLASESSFYQSRWHSGLAEGQRTVAQFLAQESVEDINPFEVRPRRSNSRRYRERRRAWTRRLGILSLMRRKLIHLSNGEQRKVLLAHALLQSPALLILDDPYAGLDRKTRLKLRVTIEHLMRSHQPVLMMTHRIEQLPAATSHLLLVGDHRVVAQGLRAQLRQHPWLQRMASIDPLAPSPRVVDSGRKELPARPGPAVVIEMKAVTIQVGRKRLLNRVDWTVRRGEHWALLGPNGSGKTTLLSLIQGDHPQAFAQQIRLLGATLDSTRTLWQARQLMGCVSPELHLHHPPGWTCFQVVCSGFFGSVGLYHSCSRRQCRLAERQLRDFGLEPIAREPFGAVSSGQQRLVLLARAVVKNPRLLILDEPCQGLDGVQRHAVLAVADRVAGQHGGSLVYVTHLADEIPRCITHVLELKTGRVVRQGPRAGWA